MQRLLIIGCGDVAQRALPWLVCHFRVYALVRHGGQTVRELDYLRALGVTPIHADLDDRRSLKRLAGLAQWLLHTAPPGNTGQRDQRTRNLVAALAARRRAKHGQTKRAILPRGISYISTSGVYGDCGGALIDETRPAAPTSDRGRRRLDAEQVLRRFAARHGLAVALLRAPGIYAADRLPLARLERGDPVLRPEDDVYTNHIHAEDLAHIARVALYRGRPGRAYNASDDSRLTMGQYYDALADAFNLPRPPRVSRDEAGQRLSAMTLSFMAESRRLGNRRIKDELGIELAYPDVAAGIAAALLDSDLY